MTQTQLCGRCKIPKSQDEFSPSYWGQRGKWCKACHRAAARGEKPPAASHEEQLCLQCGKQYVPKALKANASFCSFACGDAYRRQSGHERGRYLQRKYGISLIEYERLLAEQGGGCAICGKRPEEQRRYTKFLHVDHCHDTGKVRGLLCDRHNLLIGQWGDDATLLKRAVAYLDRT